MWWFIYFAFRCTDREVSEQDQQHPQPWFKTNTRWILNHSAGLSTLRHFKSLSRSFNTSTSVAGQLQGQRAFQWSEDFCHCGVPVCFFLINLMSHARQWEHRSGFIGDFYYDALVFKCVWFCFVQRLFASEKTIRSLHHAEPLQKNQIKARFSKQLVCSILVVVVDFTNHWLRVIPLCVPCRTLILDLTRIWMRCGWAGSAEKIFARWIMYIWRQFRAVVSISWLWCAFVAVKIIRKHICDVYICIFW